MSIPLGLLVLCFAVARATRLITEDVIFEPFRRFFVNRYGEDHKLTILVHCPWCVSMWLGFLGALFACIVLSISFWWFLPLSFLFSQAAVFAHVVVDGR